MLLCDRLRVLKWSEADQAYRINFLAFVVNVIAALGAFIGTYVGTNSIGPHVQGFWCSDNSIRYPFRHSTVTATMLFIYSIGITSLVVIAAEINNKFVESRNEKAFILGSTHIPAFFVNIAKNICYAQLGLICTLILTDVAKCTVGRLRPHFLDICQPIGSICTNPNDFVSNYTCGGIPERVAEARKSFFSGHSSYSMYATVWSIIFIQRKFKKWTAVPMALIQTFLLSIGLYICYSRVNDYKHHVGDVIVGIVAGTAIAIYMHVYWMNYSKYSVLDDISTTKSSSEIVTTFAESNASSHV